MSLSNKIVVLTATAAAAVYAQDEKFAYFSLKGLTYDVDGYNENGYLSSGFNRYGVDKLGASYDAKASAEGRRIVAVASTSPSPAILNPVIETAEVVVVIADEDEDRHDKHHKKDRYRDEEGNIRDKDGQIVDKLWYHMSNRPLPTVTETQTQFRFMEMYVTSNVAPTEDFWCDGGWIQMTKKGDLMDDEWAIKYITGYLNIIGASVDAVDTYDWCFNTKDKTNPGACAWNYVATDSQADIDATFANALDDDTSIITLHLCNKPDLESFCQKTQSKYVELSPLRLSEATFVKNHGNSRPHSPTPCLDGTGGWTGPNPAGGKTFNWAPAGQYIRNKRAEACPEVAHCLMNTCTQTPPVAPTMNVTSADWVLESGCAQCEVGFFYDTLTKSCDACTNVAGCKAGAAVCTNAMDSSCTYGNCNPGCTSYIVPGGNGQCVCDDPCADANVVIDNNACGKLCVTQEGLLIRDNHHFTDNCLAMEMPGASISSIAPDVFEGLVNLLEVDLSDNNLSEVPDVFVDVPELQNLGLAGNNLISFPEAIQHLTSLVTVSVAENHIPQIFQNETVLLTNLANLYVGNMDPTMLCKPIGTFTLNCEGGTPEVDQCASLPDCA